MSDTPRNPLSSAAVRSLLNAAARLRQQGDTQRARAVLRALAVQCPNNPWVWRALADVAESEEERRTALRRVVALVRAAAAAAPGMPPAAPSAVPGEPEARAPGKISAPLSSTAPPLAAQPVSTPSPVPPPIASKPVTASPPPSAAQSSLGTPHITPPAPPDLPAAPAGPFTRPADRSPMPQPARTALPPLARYNWIGIAAVGAALVIFAALLTNARFPGATTGTAPTPILATLEPAGSPASAAPSPGLPATVPTTAPATPGSPAQSAQQTPVAPTGAPPPTATVTPSPTLTPPPTLPAGTVILRDAWTLTLLRPDHAVVLNGPIGSRQPNGRFVLALVAVGNNSGAAITAPSELFVLMDDQGNRYLPEPGLSTLYLETFGHGKYGDFSLDETIPAGIGQVSVPVIFDVPVDTRGLTLHLGDSAAGWPVMGLP